MDIKQLKDQPMGWHATADFVRERDGHRCRKCGRERRAGERKLYVHHMNGHEWTDRAFRRDHKPEELITLCRKCHLNLPHIRERMSRGRKRKK